MSSAESPLFSPELYCSDGNRDVSETRSTVTTTSLVGLTCPWLVRSYCSSLVITDGNSRYPSKLLSIFDPETEIIGRGKAGKPTEFGRLVKIREAETNEYGLRGLRRATQRPRSLCCRLYASQVAELDGQTDGLFHAAVLAAVPIMAGRIENMIFFITK
jgi:hypothetical protein